jgi:hypothetical protein
VRHHAVAIFAVGRSYWDFAQTTDQTAEQRGLHGVAVESDWHGRTPTG